MSGPFKFLAAWAAAAIAFGLLIPVVALVGKLGGGLLALLFFGSLAISGVGLVAYSLSYGWSHRRRSGIALMHWIIPVVTIPSCFLLLRPLAELSWQAIWGSRNIPIWPYW